MKVDDRYCFPQQLDKHDFLINHKREQKEREDQLFIDMHMEYGGQGWACGAMSNIGKMAEWGR